MTPDQLAKSGSEHGHQAALFAYAEMAKRHGFRAADDMESYSSKEYVEQKYGCAAGWPCLEDFHAIPNGGERHKAVAGNLKAEGVKRGIPDTMLPFSVGRYHGLYIEMKKPGDKETKKRKGVISDDQLERIARLRSYLYRVDICFTWREAANALRNYLTGA